MHSGKAIFRRKDEALGQIVAGHYLALLFRHLQKLSRSLGGGGVIHIKNADDGRFPHRHIITDG